MRTGLFRVDWYRLSDPALEKQLARDLLFRRFVGLDIAESVPDHSSFWRFRQTLQRLSLLDTLLKEINQQLVEQGALIKPGGVSIVDASVIEAKQSRPNKGKDGESTQDPAADWNVKAGSDGVYFGLSGHPFRFHPATCFGVIRPVGFLPRLTSFLPKLFLFIQRFLTL